MLGEKDYKELESCFSAFERRQVEIIFGIPVNFPSFFLLFSFHLINSLFFHFN